MGNSISDSAITVLCMCQNEMKSSTPGGIYEERIRCCGCNISIAHSDVMFHCSNSNKYNHIYRYDLCKSCSINKSLKVFCKYCKNKRKMNKICIGNKHKGLQCNQCNKQIRHEKYVYQCKTCNCCIICVCCAKNPYILHHKQQQYINKLNDLNTNMNANNIQNIMTTLHGYAMIGPYMPQTDMVWYCDNPTCQYTKYGVYEKYTVQIWRSSAFGQKFVLCHGCVRQYEKQQQPVIVVQPQFKVQLQPNQNRDETEPIQNQIEGSIETNNFNFSDIARNIAFTVTAKLNDKKPIDEWWYT